MADLTDDDVDSFIYSAFATPNEVMLAKHIKALRERCEWRPIETAPRGQILVFDLWSNGKRYADCGWDRPTYSDMPKGTRCFVQFNASYDCDGPIDEEVKNPTHWMPLPMPPRSAAGES